MHYRSTPRLLLASLLAACILAATGCGQKGDLYLPDKDGSAQRR